MVPRIISVGATETRRCCDVHFGQLKWVQSRWVDLRSPSHDDYPRARAVMLRIA
jgi:hypothetical protein